MAFRLSSDDVSGFKLLFLLSIVYGLLSVYVYSIVNMKFISPLGLEAPLDRFSEARAIEHVRALSKDIDGRQEGRPGLKQAVHYIKGQLELIKDRAGSNMRIEIEETVVNGSFSMLFLGHNISLTYRDHINIVMRMSSANSQDLDTSLLLNGHFDSPLASPGAGDCGSCVASLLELARLIVDSGWVPPRPIIFLFNGAEELFMVGTHGFMRTHKWSETVGAFINVEASGTGGPDLVCQSGPGPWPSEVYAQSAVYPMAHSAAQDVFPVVPGDTDYRIFAKDYGNIPGLDIIFVLGGYFYHTEADTMDRLLPGSIQARGDNLVSITKAFVRSSKLKNAKERASYEATSNSEESERAVFFDYLTWFLVYYSHKVAVVLHSIPVALFFSMPFLLHLKLSGLRYCGATLFDFMKGILFHTAGVLLAVIFPVIFSVVRLFFTSHAMNWFAHPYLAFIMFVPCALVGLAIPRSVSSCFPLRQVSAHEASKEAVYVEARFWGAFGFYASLTMVYLLAGLSGGFLTFMLCSSMLLAWIVFCFTVKSHGHKSLRSTMFYVIPQIPFLAYSVYFGGFLVQFLVEKMGMMGSVPPPFGYFIPDAVVAAVVGVVTGWCVGPLLPVCDRWLARRSIIQFLLHLSIIGLALSSQFFPYTNAAPKRVVFQHSIVTSEANQVVGSSYDFSVVDSNSLLFLFKHSPDVAKELQISPDLSYETARLSHREEWMALFPISFLFSRSLKFPVKSDDIINEYRDFPHLSTYEPHTSFSKEGRRVHLKLSLGSAKEVWVTVLNITGPLSGWSFVDNVLSDPELVDGSPPSYICRLTGGSHKNWTFWLEASSDEGLRVEVAVLEQHLVDSANKLKGLFPDWVDVIAYSSFMSTYIF